MAAMSKRTMMVVTEEGVGAATTGRLSCWVWCPGCDDIHRVVVRNPDGSSPAGSYWSWDGSMVAPTFEPSIKVTGGGKAEVCHSFLRAGVWEFLPDCTHALAGTAAPMVPLPSWFHIG